MKTAATPFPGRKLLLLILFTLPFLMVIGGMRTPNLANLNELRPHVHHCTLFETRHKAAETEESGCPHTFQNGWCPVVQTPPALRFADSPFTKLFDTAFTKIFPSRASPSRLA